MIRCSCEIEAQMAQVERIFHLANTPSEAELRTNNVPSQWPNKGSIEFEKVVLKYREDLPPALNDISLVISGQEKIGVVGRTGAGKSSLVNCLFRIIELSGGRILIDGVDISTLGLHDLREQLSIIPQDATLYSGTIRTNLDPNEQYQEHQLWYALEQVSLKPFVSELPDKLDHLVEEGGVNFSVGQKQLLCMARALLKGSKILILDEATASVDQETDLAIQKTLLEAFANRTVLVIAHRLATIINLDRVLVLQQGKVLELGHPADLLDNPDSEFSKLVEDTGPKSAEYLRRTARNNRELKRNFNKNL
jgi:ABC-type multidrug transport system fused ATPase/permease subunit